MENNKLAKRMEYNKLVRKGIIQGIGTAFVIFVVRTLDKKLASAITIKSALVLIGSVTLANVGIEYAEKNNYA